MSLLPLINVVNLKHRQQQQIGLQFDYNTELKFLVKSTLKAKWSTTHRLWYLLHTKNNYNKMQALLGTKARLDFSTFNRELRQDTTLYNKRDFKFNAKQRALLNGFYMYLKGKRYSKSTVETYTYFMAEFVSFHATFTPEDYTNALVDRFAEAVLAKKGYSISSHRQFISALKQFTAYYPNTGISSVTLERPKKSKILPTVLSAEEMISLIRHTKNLKHRAVLALLYSCGLRISELLQLRLTDFNLQRKQLHIHSGKGRKDRYVSLADSFIPLLQNYVTTYTPEVYFVEGKKGRPYSASSVRKFLTSSCKAAGIARRITPHTLRHSYATHLLEYGVGLRHIQELLGHAKPETTMIYTHVARKDLLDIGSPLDLAVSSMQKGDKLEQKFHISGT